MAARVHTAIGLEASDSNKTTSEFGQPVFSSAIPKNA